MKRCSTSVLESVRIWLITIVTTVAMLAGTVNAAAVYQINCGGSAVSPYATDQYYSGGTANSVTNTITITGITNPAPAGVYQKERYGAVTYTIPSLTANTQYLVRLHFCELYQTAANTRKFNVSINSTSVLSNFDLYATAGARYKAILREFTATANASGQIIIALSNVTNNATISGIEIHTVGTPPTIATAAAVSPNPVTGTTASLSVLGADDGGESNLTYTWATTVTPPAAVTFSANGTNAAKNSTATFTLAGSYTLQATIRDAGSLAVTSSVTFTVNQTLSSISVTPSAPSVSATSTQQFSASARDQFGTALIMQPTFTWAASGGGSINSSGLFTAGGTPGGPYTVTASSSTSGTAQVTVTANTVPTVPTAAASSPNPATGTTANLSVLGADNGGESNLTYAWSTTGTPPAAATFSVNGTNAAKASTATFTHAGAYAIRATITDALGLSVTSDVNVTVNQTLTTVAVSPATAGVNLNMTQQFTASGSDQFGTAMSTQPTFTWTVSGGGTINSSSGLFTAGGTAGGPYTVTATGGGRNGTAQVTVTSDPAPTIAAASSANPNHVAGATTTQLSVLGADNGGEANLIYTWSTTGTPPAVVAFSVNGTNAAKNSTVTFTQAGDYTFRVTVRDVLGGQVTSDVSVTVYQSFTTISVTPSIATVNINHTQQFTASALDQFGTALTTQPTFTWTVSGGGTISSTTGLFTAGSIAGGPFSITATDIRFSGTASVSVQLVPLTYVYPNVCAANQNMKVDGQIKCNSLLIYNWLLSQKGAPPPPDYVFGKDYKLPTLAETEKFIKANGHLPEVPAAGELESKGVDMIQLNFILLKKIEEMTLHMIRQQKEIEELKKK